jgi:hypothetical protein
VFRFVQPTREHAIALYDRTPGAAMTEANAYDAIHGVNDDTISAVDELDIRKIRPDASITELSERLTRPWRSEAARRVVRGRLIVLARARGEVLMREANDSSALQTLAGEISMVLPDERTLWVAAAELIDAPERCFNPEPDAFCLRRELDLAESARVPANVRQSVQLRFVSAAEVWLDHRLSEAHMPCPVELDADRLDTVATYARSIESQLQVHLTFDHAAVETEAERVRAGCCPCRGLTRADPDAASGDAATER